MAYRATDIGIFLNSRDPELRRRALQQLTEAIRLGRGLHGAAERLGVSWRSVYRWTQKAGIEVQQKAPVSDAEIRKAASASASAEQVAERLGVHVTTVHRRAGAAGIRLPDGRTRRVRKAG